MRWPVFGPGQAILNFPGKQSVPSTAEQACVTAAEAQRLTVRAPWKGTLLTSFALERLDLGLGNSRTGDSLQKMQPDGSVIWLLLKCPCVCVCVCVCERERERERECVTPGVVIQTHVNIIFSDQSGLFYCKCGIRLAGILWTPAENN